MDTHYAYHLLKGRENELITVHYRGQDDSSSEIVNLQICGLPKFEGVMVATLVDFAYTGFERDLLVVSYEDPTQERTYKFRFWIGPEVEDLA